MKILQLNSASKLTGEAAHSNDLAWELQSAGHEVHVVVKKGTRVESEAISRGITNVHGCWFPPRLNLRQWKHDFLLLRRLIKEVQPDVIHCHRGDDHGLASVATFFLPGRPALVRTRHRVIPVRLLRGNRWLFLRRTDGVISVSDVAARSFGPMLDWIKDHHTIIYSSADAHRFNPAQRDPEWRTQYGLADEHQLVGLIARLQRVKGQTVFLQAAAIVARDLPNVRFLISGRGPAHKMPRLRQLASDLGIADKVIFEEWLPEVHRVMASLDVGVVASLGSEGSSRITYESMASGLPVVATAVGCIPEVVVDGETGYIVQPGDAEEMAGAIIKAVKDPEHTRALGARAYERFQQCYSRPRWVQETLKVYDQAVQRRRAGTSFKAWLQDVGNILRSGQVEAEHKPSRRVELEQETPRDKSEPLSAG